MTEYSFMLNIYGRPYGTCGAFMPYFYGLFFFENLRVAWIIWGINFWIKGLHRDYWNVKKYFSGIFVLGPMVCAPCYPLVNTALFHITNPFDFQFNIPFRLILYCVSSFIFHALLLQYFNFPLMLIYVITDPFLIIHYYIICKFILRFVYRFRFSFSKSDPFLFPRLYSVSIIMFI